MESLHPKVLTTTQASIKTNKRDSTKKFLRNYRGIFYPIQSKQGALIIRIRYSVIPSIQLCKLPIQLGVDVLKTKVPTILNQPLPTNLLMRQ